MVSIQYSYKKPEILSRVARLRVMNNVRTKAEEQNEHICIPDLKERANT